MKNNNFDINDYDLTPIEKKNIFNALLDFNDKVDLYHYEEVELFSTIFDKYINEDDSTTSNSIITLLNALTLSEDQSSALRNNFVRKGIDYANYDKKKEFVIKIKDLAFDIMDRISFENANLAYNVKNISYNHMILYLIGCLSRILEIRENPIPEDIILRNSKEPINETTLFKNPDNINLYFDTIPKINVDVYHTFVDILLKYNSDVVYREDKGSIFGVSECDKEAVDRLYYKKIIEELINKSNPAFNASDLRCASIVDCHFNMISSNIKMSKFYNNYHAFYYGNTFSRHPSNLDFVELFLNINNLIESDDKQKYLDMLKSNNNQLFAIINRVVEFNVRAIGITTIAKHIIHREDYRTMYPNVINELEQRLKKLKVIEF